MTTSKALGTSFRWAGVASAYRHRPPYPAELFDTLEGLVVARPRTVLDIGAGDGALARPLARRVDRVDAVEISPAMAEAGRHRAGGSRTNLVWLVGAAETVDLAGPYALATAGASLHWMDWDVTLRRVGRALAPDAMLAIVDQTYHDLAWQEPLVEVIVRHSRNPEFDPRFSLPDELERRQLFKILGRAQTRPTEFRQSVDDYVEQFHSRASLARELMTTTEAVAFGQEIREVVAAFASDTGELTMHTTGLVVWGRPGG